jgi:mediator of RNA polymerase II transcription subunit 15
VSSVKFDAHGEIQFNLLCSPDNKNKNPEGGNSQAGAQQQPGIQDPINALQNLATQGTRNVQPQMMGQQPQQSQQMPGMMPVQNQQQPVMGQQGNMQQGMIRPMMGQQMGQNQVNLQPQMNQMMNQGPGQVKSNPGGPMNAGPMNAGPMNAGPMMNQMVPGGNQQGMLPGNQMIPGNQMMPRGMAPVNPAMINPGQQQQMMNMRKQEMMMPNQVNAPGQFPQVRNVAPNFLRQSPSPMSVPSPIGLSQSQHNQMVASPAMVPSPQAPRPGMQNVMAPSPSANMNTPGQPQGDYVQSPMNPHDDQIYREKYNQLTKYKEPLKKVIQRVGPENNSEKLTKLKKLLEILSNPEARIPLETLVKCEIVLVNQFGALKDTGTASINNPLYDAIQSNLQNPLANHTVQRSFKPSLEAWFGPDVKNLPPAKKRRLSEDQVVPNAGEIPHALQGEIARLDAKFKISLDQTSHSTGAKNIKLICSLDDALLPCVPPINITIPEEYPFASPHCNVMEHSTPSLMQVEKALKARISKLPELFSLTHILETWTLAIRQACNPSFVEPTQMSVIWGV